MTSPCHKDKNNNKIYNIKRKIHQNLIKKYENLSKEYNSNIIDNIIYNERSHIVSLFKDRLILDDKGEFLKRYYNFRESVIRLPKFFEYYDLHSKIFPNYTSLPEGKYFYQNIEKKQKVIDIIEEKEIENIKKKDNKNEHTEIKIKEEEIFNSNKTKNSKYRRIYVFSTDVRNFILNETNKEDIELLFNVNKDNISKEEDIFSEKIHDIIKIINKFEINKNNKKYYNVIKKNESYYKKKEAENESKSHSGNKKKINNTVLGNEINNNKYVKLNYFNKSTIRKNTIFNLNNGRKTNNSINLKNNSINKLNKNDKNFIKIIEHNIFKKRQLITKYHTKNIIHNISSSTSIKKELSSSKRNSSNNSKKPNASSSSFNLFNINISHHHQIKKINKINHILNKKRLEIKMKHPIKSSNLLISRNIGKTLFNVSIDKKKVVKHKVIKIKYNYSSNNINNSNKHKKSLSNGQIYKNNKHSILTYLGKNNLNIQKKIINITNNDKKIKKRKIIKNNFNNKIIYKKRKNKNSINYLIDSRNYIFNDFLNSYKNRKTNSSKRNNINCKLNSIYNISKSRSKSNKKNSSKNNLFESSNSNLLIKKTKIKNDKSNNFKQKKNNKKNIINKFNWKIDSRNKRALFISKNNSKFKTKNILCQNDSSLKLSSLGEINCIKNSNKNKDIRNYSKIFKYINYNKNNCSKTQRNFSFNNT